MNAATRMVPAVVAMLALSGCATSSGALSTGKDSYSISVQAAPARGGMTGAKRIAYEEGRKKCAETGKQMVLIKESTNVTNAAGAGSADIQFACVSPNEPDYQRRRTSPDVIIESR